MHKFHGYIPSCVCVCVMFCKCWLLWPVSSPLGPAHVFLSCSAQMLSHCCEWGDDFQCVCCSSSCISLSQTGVALHPGPTSTWSPLLSVSLAACVSLAVSHHCRCRTWEAGWLMWKCVLPFILLSCVLHSCFIIRSQSQMASPHTHQRVWMSYCSVLSGRYSQFHMGTLYTVEVIKTQWRGILPILILLFRIQC